MVYLIVFALVALMVFLWRLVFLWRRDRTRAREPAAQSAAPDFTRLFPRDCSR